MPGTSEEGYPYVLPADHPLEFPALSQQLATALDPRTRSIGGAVALSGSIASNATGNSSLPISSVLQLWGGTTATAGGVVLYVPRTGVYQVSISVAFPTSGAGSVRAAWLIMSTVDAPPTGYSFIGATSPPSTSTAGTGLMLSASGLWKVDSGKGIVARVRQDSGASQTVTGQIALQFVHD